MAPTVSLTVSDLDPEEAEKLLALLAGDEEETPAKSSKSKKESKKSKASDDDDEDDEDEDDEDDEDEDEDDEDDDEDEDDEDDEDEDEVFDKKSLKAKAKSDLVDIAKGMKLRKLDGLGKTELVDKILKAQARKG